VVEECANPSCRMRFRKFGNGRLFVVESPAKSESRRPQYFWLCSACSRSMTVSPKNGGEVTVVPLPTGRAASSMCCDYNHRGFPKVG